MEMWCPDDGGRDSWDWVGPPTGESMIQVPRACFNSRKWCGSSSGRIRIVAKGNGAFLDWIIVVVLVALVLD